MPSLDKSNAFVPPARMVALIRWPQQSTVRHYIGLPQKLAKDGDVQIDLPSPQVLLLQTSRGKRGFILDRLTEDGTLAGDTWHASVADAQEQAFEEYGAAVGDWHNIPESIDDTNLTQFAIAYALGEHNFDHNS